MKSGWDKLLGSPRSTRASTEKLIRAAQMSQLQEHRRLLLSSEKNSDPRRLLCHGYRVHSQSDEDGILHEIFRRIGPGSRTFIEIGASDGAENNTLFLLTQGWRGSWIEGSVRKVAAAKKDFATWVKTEQLRVEQNFVTQKNINDIVGKLTSSPEIDLLSLDIDGNDYYVLEAIHSVTPRVIVVEYNAKFPPDVAWVMEYNEGHHWDATDYFGASLKALEILLSSRGYSLVGCNLLGCNAFFVRTNLLTDDLFCPPFTAENHYEPPRYFLLPAFDSGFPPGFGPFRIIIPQD